MTEQRVQSNKVVQFTYTIVDEAGNEIEKIDKPVQYIHGSSSIGLVESVENAMAGARVGDKVETEVPPDESFGQHDPDLTFVDGIENVPPEFRKIGTKVEMKNDRGEGKEFIITKIEDNKVTFDGNHPLAGKTMTFIVSIIAIRDATIDEIKNGGTDDSTVLH